MSSDNHALSWCVKVCHLRVSTVSVNGFGTKRYLPVWHKGYYDNPVCEKTNNAVLLLDRKGMARSPSLFICKQTKKSKPAAPLRVAGFVSVRACNINVGQKSVVVIK